MTRRCVRGAGAVLVAVVVAATATACSDDGGSASATVSKAASAASSVAPRGADAVASATAAARDKLNSFKDGVNASGDVKAGAATTGKDGRATSKVTVRNGSDSKQSYAVQVNFRDPKGNLLDTVVVTASGMPVASVIR